MADLIDRQISSLGLLAMDAGRPASGETILDVGCGAGQTLLQLADRVGTRGRVIGVDLAPRVLAVASARTSHLLQIELAQADAAKLALPDASVDGIYSRFGVMFFADPERAFRNARRMLRPGGWVAFACWRALVHNELDRFPLQAAGVEPSIDRAPFSFENPAVVRGLLENAGYSRISIIAADRRVSAGGAEATYQVITRVGALGMVLRHRPSLLAEIGAPLRAALNAREADGKVWLNAAVWIVNGVAS